MRSWRAGSGASSGCAARGGWPVGRGVQGDALLESGAAWRRGRRPDRAGRRVRGVEREGRRGLPALRGRHTRSSGASAAWGASAGGAGLLGRRVSGFGLRRRKGGNERKAESSSGEMHVPTGEGWAHRRDRRPDGATVPRKDDRGAGSAHEDRWQDVSNSRPRNDSGVAGGRPPTTPLSYWCQARRRRQPRFQRDIDADPEAFPGFRVRPDEEIGVALVAVDPERVQGGDPTIDDRDVRLRTGTRSAP